MKVLITGSRGLIGRYLVSKLQEDDSITIDVLNREKRESSESDIGEFDYSDLNNIDFNNYNVVFQLGFARADKGPVEIASSIMNFENLLSCAESNNNLKFVNISSQEVYGNTLGDRFENFVVKPTTVYGFAKLFTEMTLSNSRQRSSWNATSIRLAGVVANEAENRMINRMVLSAIEKGEIVVNGATKKFSFIEVRDVVNALAAMIASNFRWADIYNLNNGFRGSLLDIATVIKSEVEKSLGKSVSIVINESQDVFDASMESSNFYKGFSWSPTFGLQEIVRSLIQNLKAR